MSRSPKPTAAGPTPASYAAAEAELEQILTALEGENVDVDQLSGHVERARELIAWCRARVAQAEVTITELLADAPEVAVTVPTGEEAGEAAGAAETAPVEDDPDD